MIANVPDYRVTLGDADLTPKLKGTVTRGNGNRRPRLVSLSISEKRGESADQLDIVLDDTDGLMALPAEGAVLHIAIGWAQGSDVTPGLVDKGSFTIDEVSHAGPPDLITIRGRSADFTSDLKTRRERSWHDTTLGSIVTEIAGHHRLKPRCAASLASIAVTDKAQSRESDLAFLRRLGRERNAVATIKGGSLILSPIGAGVTPSGKALPAIKLQRRNGDGHSFSRQKRDDVAGVTATWHDRKGARREAVTAGKPDGAKKLARVYGSEAEARDAANAAKSKAARLPVTLDLNLSLGRPDVFPEQKATVAGYKQVIDAVSWLVSEVTHSIGDRGYTTKLKLEAGG